ncbi:hypothetical protein [Brevibacterium limosum]|uniref:hypothetical protein n=1 Tax=Brevibacterium limosum TaxID=2697565 RepID=UPI0014209EC9|nr:hypothetical protein [Brevibacterium limosum]
MNGVIKGDGKASIVVGWMLTVMALLALVTVIVLTFVIETWFLVFLFGPVVLLLGAWVNFHMGSRARLEITPEEFIWCGFMGRPHRIAWRDLDRVLIPAPGSRPRLPAAARLTTGAVVEIEALWLSPTSLANLLSSADHSQAQRALIDGHQAYLARTP